MSFSLYQILVFFFVNRLHADDTDYTDYRGLLKI